MKDTLIVSIGSSIMTDDAIGHYILQNLKDRNLQADFLKLDTDIFRLRLYYKGQKRIIILDALVGEKPREIKIVPYNKFSEQLEGKIRDAHLLGVIEGIEIMREVDRKLAEAEIIFVGIGIEDISLGTELSSSIKTVVEDASKKIIPLIK